MPFGSVVVISLRGEPE
jgi:hypothetical protein